MNPSVSPVVPASIQALINDIEKTPQWSRYQDSLKKWKEAQTFEIVPVTEIAPEFNEQLQLKPAVEVMPVQEAQEHNKILGLVENWSSATQYNREGWDKWVHQSKGYDESEESFFKKTFVPALVGSVILGSMIGLRDKAVDVGIFLTAVSLPLTGVAAIIGSEAIKLKHSWVLAKPLQAASLEFQDKIKQANEQGKDVPIKAAELSPMDTKIERIQFIASEMENYFKTTGHKIPNTLSEEEKAALEQWMTKQTQPLSDIPEGPLGAEQYTRLYKLHRDVKEVFKIAQEQLFFTHGHTDLKEQMQKRAAVRLAEVEALDASKVEQVSVLTIPRLRASPN